MDLEDRVANDHPLRAIRVIVNDALAGLSEDFEGMYAKIVRPSIPPEKLRALLLQATLSRHSVSSHPKHSCPTFPGFVH